MTVEGKTVFDFGGGWSLSFPSAPDVRVDLSDDPDCVYFPLCDLAPPPLEDFTLRLYYVDSDGTATPADECCPECEDDDED